MKTLLTAKIPHTNVEVSYISDGRDIYFRTNEDYDAHPSQKCCSIADERVYMKGVRETLERFTNFKII